KAMSSTASATLATWFKIKGVNYSISSACATSNHCIGNAYEMIQYGKQDVMFAGGCEELDWSLSVLFDAMGAMSSKHNATPATASRPYDVSRDGFVIAGGAGEGGREELERAKALARRHRRSGGDLLAADDEERLRLRERQHHRARSHLRGHADRAQAHRQRQARRGVVELVRLRRHERDAGVQAARRLRFFNGTG